MFDITEHVEFNAKGRAVCPACAQTKGGNHRKLNLSILPSGAYNCFAGCSTAEIKDALGVVVERVVPTALAQPAAKTTISPVVVTEAWRKLRSHDAAMAWLTRRGIDEAIINRYSLGLVRAKCGKQYLPAIAIPIPANPDRTHYYQKKRVSPWVDWLDNPPPEYKPWSQYGIPAMVWLTHNPPKATETYLCEGEWDAMVLGHRHALAESTIAVATFTCGCDTVPPAHELERLPGKVTIFYDRQDKPTKHGVIPGDAGAKKVAKALGDRGWIAQVPMPDNCTKPGWDVSDAIKYGYTFTDFTAAAGKAQPVSELPSSPPSPAPVNRLKERMVSTDDLVERAPDYVEWLIPDILTTDELFVLGAPPRGGKSLMCMLLAKSIATGQPFLDRPTTQGSVLYVNLEDGEAKVKERVEAQQWAKGLPVYWIDKFKLDETADLIALAKEMTDLRLIILDTLSRVRNNDVSESAAEMSQVLEPLQEFAKHSKVCVLLVHHTRKLSVQEDTIEVMFDSLRGSSAIRGTSRGLLIIAPSSEGTYRLAIENGWGKHDLKIRLHVQTLEWQLMGKWSPLINVDQKDQALDYLSKVGSATIDQLSEGTGIQKRSLYVVLDRMHRDGLVTKSGSRRSTVYHRPIQQIQLLNSLLNSAKPDATTDTGVIQQKNNIFSSQQSGSSGSIHLATSPEKALFVEKGGKKAPTPDPESVTPIQQQFNSNSTVELAPGDQVTYTGLNPFMMRLCKNRVLQVVALFSAPNGEGEMVSVTHPEWLTDQSIKITFIAKVDRSTGKVDQRRGKKMEVSDANG